MKSNSCSICNLSAGYFSSYNCRSGDRVHKSCIKSLDRFGDHLKCKECIFLVLSKKEISGEVCILCSKRLNKNPGCKIYRKLCDECQIDNIVKSHLLSCKNCKENLLGKMTKCFKCEDFFCKTKVVHSPRCESHWYCYQCINQGEIDFGQCASCKFYFNFLTKKQASNALFCNLCGKFPEGKCFRCSLGHDYCKFCLKLLNIKLIQEFKRITDCVFCVDILKDYFHDSRWPSQPPSKASSLKRVKPIKFDPFDLNSFYPSKDTCMTCPTTEGFIFPCGHSHCQTCIIEKYFGDIRYILAQIDQNFFSQIPSKFQFKCITPDCLERIPIPSEMVKSVISSRLDKKDLQIFERISAYFDGIPMQMTRCACENLVIIMRNQRFYCTCRNF